MALQIEISVELFDIDQNGVKTSLSKNSTTKDAANGFSAKISASVSGQDVSVSVTED